MKKYRFKEYELELLEIVQRIHGVRVIIFTCYIVAIYGKEILTEIKVDG